MTPKQHDKTIGGEAAQGQGLSLVQTPMQEGKPNSKKWRGANFTLGVFRLGICQGTKLGQDHTTVETPRGYLKQQLNTYMWQGGSAHCSALRP
jgi:hypothetical protein